MVLTLAVDVSDSLRFKSDDCSGRPLAMNALFSSSFFSPRYDITVDTMKVICTVFISSVLCSAALYRQLKAIRRI